MLYNLIVENILNYSDNFLSPKWSEFPFLMKHKYTSWPEEKTFVQMSFISIVYLFI